MFLTKKYAAKSKAEVVLKCVISEHTIKEDA